VVIGLVARDAGIPTAWTVSAVLFLITAPAYLLLGRHAPLAEPLAAPLELEEPIAPKVIPTSGS
jgi:hypothetical protein